MKLGRNASRIKAVCRTSPATAKIPRQAMAFRGSKCVTVFEVGYGVYAKGRETTAAAIAFREYEKCYQRANSLIGDFQNFGGRRMLVRKESRRKDRRQAAGHGYEGRAVPAFDYGGIKEKAG